MIKIRKIKNKKSKFGTSFGGKMGKTKFYKITSDKEYVGEVEFLPKQSEILSLYIDKTFRGQGIGREVINQLFDICDVKNINVLSAKSSLPFWKKVSTQKLKNNYFRIEKIKK